MFSRIEAGGPSLGLFVAVISLDRLTQFSGNRASGPDFGRILIGKASKSGLPKAGRRADFDVFQVEPEGRLRPFCRRNIIGPLGTI